MTKKRKEVVVWNGWRTVFLSLPVARLNKHGGRGGKSAGKQRDPHHVEQAAVPSVFFSKYKPWPYYRLDSFSCEEQGCISVQYIRLFVINWIPFNIKHTKIEPEIFMHWQMIASYKQSYYSKRNKIINYWLNSAALKDKRQVGQHPNFDFYNLVKLSALYYHQMLRILQGNDKIDLQKSHSLVTSCAPYPPPW